MNGRHVHHVSWPLHEVGALLQSRSIRPGRSWVRNRLKGLARDGWTVLVSSHLMAEIALTADEVIIISAGPAGSIPAGSARRQGRLRLRGSAATSTHLP